MMNDKERPANIRVKENIDGIHRPIFGLTPDGYKSATGLKIPFWITDNFPGIYDEVRPPGHSIRVEINGAVSYEGPEWPDGTTITIEHKGRGLRVFTQVGENAPGGQLEGGSQ